MTVASILADSNIGLCLSTLCMYVCMYLLLQNAAFLVLAVIIKLTKRTGGRDWSGRLRVGRIGGGGNGEEGLEGIILCLILTYKAFRFPVPPAVALLNYMRM